MWVCVYSGEVSSFSFGSNFKTLESREKLDYCGIGNGERRERKREKRESGVILVFGWRRGRYGDGRREESGRMPHGIQ